MTKKENPFDVKTGQVWKAKDKRRKGKFTVTGIDKTGKEYFAVAAYPKGKTIYNRMINLKRFDRYLMCK